MDITVYYVKVILFWWLICTHSNAVFFVLFAVN